MYRNHRQDAGATERPTGKMPAPRSHCQPGCPAMKGLGLRRPLVGLRYKTATTRVPTCRVAFPGCHFQTIPVTSRRYERPRARRRLESLRYKSATTRVATCGVAFLRLHFQTVPPSGVRLALTAKLSSYYQARGVFRKQSVSILFRLAERKGAQWQ